MPTRTKQPRIVSVALRLPSSMGASEAQERIDLLGRDFFRARLSQDRSGVVVLQAREMV